jgi:hypothetical protein
VDINHKNKTPFHIYQTIPDKLLLELLFPWFHGGWSSAGQPPKGILAAVLLADDS